MNTVEHTAEERKSTNTELRPGSILDQADTIESNDQDSSKLRPGSVLYHLAKIGESNTTPRGKTVLSGLARFHNEKTGQCNPSHKALANWTGYGERTIRKILKEDLAHLVTYQHGKYSNQYTLFPPMLVSSPAPGTISVSDTETATSLGTRGPGEKCSHSAHGGRFTRHTGAGSLGTRGPANIQGTNKEHFVKGQQKTFSPTKGKAIKPTLEAVQAAFEKRGLPSGQAKTEAKHFLDYNNKKNWHMPWEQGVERWRPQEPAQQTAESRPVLPLYKPPEVEEHTPEQRESNLAVLRGTQQPLIARAEPKARQVGKILTAKERRDALLEEQHEAEVRRWEEEQALKARRKTA